MARTKSLHIRTTYTDTDWVVNDLGEGKKPRFELYNTKTKETLAKSNNPMDFDDIMLKKVYKVKRNV